MSFNHEDTKTQRLEGGLLFRPLCLGAFVVLLTHTVAPVSVLPSRRALGLERRGGPSHIGLNLLVQLPKRSGRQRRGSANYTTGLDNTRSLRLVNKRPFCDGMVWSARTPFYRNAQAHPSEVRINAACRSWAAGCLRRGHDLVHVTFQTDKGGCASPHIIYWSSALRSGAAERQLRSLTGWESWSAQGNNTGYQRCALQLEVYSLP